MIDFGALPPEVNSTRMHCGLGSETLVTSATAWTALAAQLGSAGAAFQEVTMALAGGPWTGPSAVTMAAAAAPYVAWVMAEAALCGERGMAATNAAMAFETARLGHIHPTIVASKKAGLAAVRWLATDLESTPQPSQPTKPSTPSSGRRTKPRCTTLLGLHPGHPAGSIINDLPAMKIDLTLLGQLRKKKCD